MSKSFKVILLVLVLLGVGLGVLRYRTATTPTSFQQWDSEKDKQADLAELEQRRLRAHANRPIWEVFADEASKPADPSKSRAAADALDPVAARASPTTWTEQAEVFRAFHNRTLIDDYDAFGDRNSSHDAEIRAFLEDLATYYTNINLPVFDQIDAPGGSELLAMAIQLVDAGVTDPLVLEAKASLLRAVTYGKAAALNLPTPTGPARYTDVNQSLPPRPTTPDSSTPVGAARVAWEAIKDSKYNDYRKFTAAMRVMDLSIVSHSPLFGERRPSNETSYWANVHAARLFESDLFAGDNEPLLLALVWRAFDNDTADAVHRLHNLIVETERYPWAVLVARGEYEIEVAWDARGGGTAGKVTDEGWEAFRKGLERAGPLLLAAHQLRPDRPEAATDLITVVMGGHPPDERDVLAWFEAATAAQSDYLPAWSAATWALRPRWGGSHAEMVELGRMAVNSDAFDTAAPYQLFQILDDIAREVDGGWVSLRRVGPLPELLRMYDGLIAAQSKRDTNAAADLVTQLKAERVATAWALGNWEIAAEGLDDPSISSEQLSAALTRLGGYSVEASAEIRLMTGPFAEQARSVMSALRSNRTDQAGRALDGLLAEMPAGTPGREYLEQQADVLVFSDVINSSAGEWVDMPIAPGFWKPVRGHWSIESDKIVCVDDAYTEDSVGSVINPHWSIGTDTSTAGLDAVLLFAPMIDGDYEVRVVVDVEGEYLLAGLLPAWNTKYPSGTLVNPNSRVRRLKIRHVSLQDANIEFGDEPIQLWARLVGLRLAITTGELAEDNRGFEALSDSDVRPMQVAIGASEGLPGESAVFTKLQIRRISTKL